MKTSLLLFINLFGFLFTQAQIQNFDAEWEIIPSGTNKNLASVFFTSVDDGWAVGSEGTILHYFDQNWELQNTGLGDYFGLSSVHFPEPSKGWAVGGYEFYWEPYGEIVHYNGTSWVKQLSDLHGGYFLNVYFLDVNHGWAVGASTSSGTESIYYYNGETWSPVNIPFGINRMQSVFFSDSTHGWFLSLHKLLKYNDGTFSVLYENPDFHFHDFHVYDSNNIWITCYDYDYYGYVLFYDGNTVTTQLTIPRINHGGSIYFTDNLHGYIVGDFSGIAKFSDNDWIFENSPTNYDLYDVFGISKKWWAVGDHGTILYKDEDTVTSIGHIPEKNELKIDIFPNPASRQLTISSNDGTVIDEVIIYTQTGQIVFRGKPVNKIIDISELQPGMYIIEVVSGQRRIREKLMID